jgi:DNA polymerase zeta
MLSPVVMIRLADLLRQGVVMKKIFQPFEAHLQYLLQWMTDYNLYGCGYIDCSKAYFRSPIPLYEEMDDKLHLWHNHSIPLDNLLKEGVLPRVSHCTLEVDICVQDILNRSYVKPRPLHHDFIERLNPLAPDEKLVHSMAELWRDETRRRKSRISNPDPGSSPFPAEVLISMSADSRNSQRGGWIHEEEYMDQVKSLILEERKKSGGEQISFDKFVKTSPFDHIIRTTLEAVEDLYPKNLAAALGLKYEATQVFNEKDVTADDIEVDENRLFGLKEEDEDTELPYDSDEEVMRVMELSQRKQGDHVQEPEIENNLNGEKLDNQFFEGPASLGQNIGSPDPIETAGISDTSTSLSGNISAKYDPILPAPVILDLIMNPASFDASNGGGDAKFQRINNLFNGDRDLKEQPDNPNAKSKSSNSQDRKSLEYPPRTVNGVSNNSATLKQSSQEFLNLEGKISTPSLGFPVVKDPQDSSTILRLSQGNYFQKNMDTVTRKQVAFGTALPLSQEQRSATIDSSGLLIDSISAKKMSDILQKIKYRFPLAANSSLLGFSGKPPSALDVISSMSDFGLPQVIYQDAYYSKEEDVPERAREWAGREFKLESHTIAYLSSFDQTGLSAATFGEKLGVVPDRGKEEVLFKKRRRACNLRSWEILESPPTFAEVREWLDQENTDTAAVQDSGEGPRKTPKPQPKLSQVDGPSQKNKYGFKYTQGQNKRSVKQEAQYMSTMSLELHVNTRGNFVPNPEEDEVQCVFWCLQSDEGLESNDIGSGNHHGIAVLSEDGSIAERIQKLSGVKVHEETSELDLIIRIVEIVRNQDPDILTGYEVHSGSWGYLIERARVKYEYNLCDELSRMKSQSHGRFGKDKDKWGFNHTSTIRVTGRHMINIWRAMRSELNLLQYTMENVAFHLLHRRVPHYSWRDLSNWYTNGKIRDLAKVVNYYVSRVQLNLDILEQNELISRTSEQARLLGVDFFSVFSRGSQFKVESLMFRIAKPENFVLVSPSRRQVGGQNALECLPLVMEPQSGFYSSPLLVLDFQSLYPSVMIAYNYCYSTFLGRVANWRGANKMGFMEFKRQERLLELLQHHVNIAPNGMMYVKPEIRKSLLAKMLGEILETRVMVKSGMKICKDDKTLQRLLNNRQLALKLIANVTYGYTSASFSGRMPCSEIADSIVQTGRETLEKAIALIHSVKRWGAEVVYGDTDSLFIYLKGRTKDQAFDIGAEIAKTVTNMNPRPVKLKFEKVYFPCVLLAKKRYVGFKYEHKDQKEPEFDAKGIETVRRDGTPAEQKIEEKALKILFRSADLSQVKSYFQNECAKIMKGSISIQDFCFAREVKLGTYSEKGLPPPGALISARRMLEDARAEPQYGERIPYVVITGAPGARLIDRCVAPETLLHSDHNELDSEYYISKNLIPPLERIFNLVGANVRNWYDEMPKVQRIRRVDAVVRLLGEPNDFPIAKKTLESYMKSSSCLVCRKKLELEGAICTKCLADRSTSLLLLRKRLSTEEKKTEDLGRVCRSCSGIDFIDEVKCDSQDCPVFYTRTRQTARLKTEKAILEPVMRLLQEPGPALEDMDW